MLKTNPFISNKEPFRYNGDIALKVLHTYISWRRFKLQKHKIYSYSFTHKLPNDELYVGKNITYIYLHLF